jgi:glycosyltransferase involved in cell wall biosynthesis
MFSIVIPVYKNEESLPELLVALSEIAAKVRSRFGLQTEVVFVVDGSPDGSHQFLARALGTASFSSKLILHARNFGSFAAIRTGLAAASGQFCGVMAADLQEPPELMLDFLGALAGGDCDVVVGCREKREDPLPSRVAAGAFWRIYRALVVPDIPPGGVDVFGCNRQFRDQLLQLEESNSSLVGLIFWLGFRRKEILYERRARKHGRSAWTLRKKLKYLFDSIFSFTDLPVRLLIAFGLLGLSSAFILGLVVLAARIHGEISVPGYAATVLTLLFFGGLNAVGLGIVGTYAWRGFENTKRRPLAVVMDLEAFGGKSIVLPDAAMSGERK